MEGGGRERRGERETERLTVCECRCRNSKAGLWTLEKKKKSYSELMETLEADDE